MSFGSGRLDLSFKIHCCCLKLFNEGQGNLRAKQAFSSTPRVIWSCGAVGSSSVSNP